MPEQKQRLAAGAGKIDFEMVATRFLREELNGAAETLKLTGQIFAEMIDRGFIVTGGFEFHQPVENLQHVSTMFLAELKERGVINGGGHRRR